MRNAAVFVFFLVALESKGSAEETKGSMAEPELKKIKDLRESYKIPIRNLSSTFSGKLLVVPMDGSHWTGVKAIAQEMGRRGHKVTVVMPEVSMRMGPGKHYDTVTFPVPYDKDCVDGDLFSPKDLMEKSEEPLVMRVTKRIRQMRSMLSFLHITAESLLFNTSIISHLAQQGFDAVLTDPMVPTGSLIARKLGLPTVNLLRAIPCSLDMKAAGCPSPVSFVPRFFTGSTDRMTFKERVINTLMASWEPLFCRLVYWHFDNIAHQFLEEKVGIAEVLSDSDVWLLRMDFALEFPRPLMPNIVLVGGISSDRKNPLPEDLESWVSGPHGFVVFTFGSMVSDMPEGVTRVFLEAFRQIPQKVIWRYSGIIRDNIPNNVKMMKWVPQNDLLAHPGARAFITHAGSHGVFEGLSHAVPMLLMPLKADQPDNARKITSRGAGVMMDITSLTTENLLQGLREVINEPRYKENIKKLSALHNDRPVDPVDLSVYWTEFVMKHKGAKHLRAAVQDLNWFQYFCLDVFVLLTTVVLVFIVLILTGLKACFRKLTGKRKKD